MIKTKFCRGQPIRILIMQWKTQKVILRFKNKLIQLKVKFRALRMLQRLHKISGKLTISRRDLSMETLSWHWIQSYREEVHYMELQELQWELRVLKIWLKRFLIPSAGLAIIIKLLKQIMLNAQRDQLDFMIVKKI